MSPRGIVPKTGVVVALVGIGVPNELKGVHGRIGGGEVASVCLHLQIWMGVAIVIFSNPRRLAHRSLFEPFLSLAL